MKLEYEKRTSLKLQDIVLKALYMHPEDLQVFKLDDAYKIPHGIEAAKALFEAITNGINIEEAYINACET